MGRFRLLVPVAGPVVGGVVFLLALGWPKLLGPTYLASRTKIHVDPTLIRAIPLGVKASSNVLNPEWVDASLAALQRGQVRVQVVSVSIGPLEPPSNDPPLKAKKPPEEFLLLRLLTRRMLDDSQATVGRPQTPRNENARPKLTDNTGKAYRQREVEVVPVEEKGRRAVPPRGLVHEVFVYEAPAANTEYLHWELPAADGGRGKTFRFTIPRSMFRRH